MAALTQSGRDTKWATRLGVTLNFYDLETTGSSPAYDQTLQFSAILTDSEFREIERVNLRCCIALGCHQTFTPMSLCCHQRRLAA